MGCKWGLQGSSFLPHKRILFCRLGPRLQSSMQMVVLRCLASTGRRQCISGPVHLRVHLRVPWAGGRGVHQGHLPSSHPGSEAFWPLHARWLPMGGMLGPSSTVPEKSSSSPFVKTDVNCWFRISAFLLASGWTCPSPFRGATPQISWRWDFIYLQKGLLSLVSRLSTRILLI